MANTAQALADKILALLKAGQFTRALKAAKLAHKKFPKEAYFANLAGMALANSGKAREAAQYFHKAFRLHPQSEDIQNNLVQALVASGQHEKAQSLIEKLLPRRAEPSELLYLNAMSLMQNADALAAMQMVEKAIAANPKHAKAHNLRGMLLSDQGRDFEAIDSYRASMELAPERPDTLSNLSLPLSRLCQGEEALELLERAISINPSHLNARHRYAIQLNEAGRQQEAKQAYHAVLGIAPGHAESLLELSLMQSREENAALYPVIKSALSHVPKQARDRLHLNFALANIYWQQAEYEKAAKVLDIANAIGAEIRPFDAVRETKQLEMIQKLFKDTPQAPEINAITSAPQPIFVIGLPRSGTTLVEQVLTAHPDVTGFGELATAERLAMAILDQGAKFEARTYAEHYRENLPKTASVGSLFIDKMPANYRYVGFLATAFPEARFICLTRDPRDVALSMWRAYFPSRGMDYTFDLPAIATVANQFGDYMLHWKALFGDQILEIGYEEIVGDIDAASKKLAQFCGLEWDAAMARPEQNTAAVRTASLTQVRKGVHTRSVGGWRRLQDQLQPFIQGLDPARWPELG